ncbi:TetR/AcrR family transcriptional regulator [Sphingomonas sp. MMS24-J45]|uniref:TetR/AcrR family transcriptional regulator n=1 Tax=Sphingomonas sp. MMS24-J45 TaxID=3238806 RepID=UPI003850DF88
MTSDGPKASYQSPLRARLKEQTSLIILDAVGTVIRQADLAAVSIAEVARIAEVTEQTVYRHYGTRDELIRAFIKWHLEQAVGGPDIQLPRTIDELLAWLETRYAAWEADRQIVSETYLSAIGRELRQPLYELGYQNVIRMLGNEHPELDEATRRIIAAAMLTLMSTENFVFLQRNLGYDAAAVHASVVTAINAMRRGLAPSEAG